MNIPYIQHCLLQPAQDQKQKFIKPAEIQAGKKWAQKVLFTSGGKHSGIDARADWVDLLPDAVSNK